MHRQISRSLKSSRPFADDFDQSQEKSTADHEDEHEGSEDSDDIPLAEARRSSRVKRECKTERTSSSPEECQVVEPKIHQQTRPGPSRAEKKPGDQTW